MTRAPWERPCTPENSVTPAADDLESQIEALYGDVSVQRTDRIDRLLEDLRGLLNRGEVRVAHFDGTWRVNPWVKKALALCIRLGRLHESAASKSIDLDTLFRRQFSVADNVRIADSSCFVRDGACISPGCTLMPNTVIQMGAFLGRNTVVGGGAGVGVCAQIGDYVQIGAGVQIHGHIEPLDGLPAIVGDGVSVGANCVIGNNIIVGTGAVLFPGLILLQQTRLYDPVNKHRIAPKNGEPLVIPPNAIIIPGSRSLAKSAASDALLSVQVGIIAGYTNEQELPPMLLDRLLVD